MREEALAGAVGGDPLLGDDGLDAAHGLALGDAGVGHAVHVAVDEVLLVVGGEMAVMRHALVVVVGHEVEDVLLEVGAGADDGVDLVLPDHLGERDAELGGGHGAGEGHEHLAAGLQVRLVALGRVEQRRGVEMAVIQRDELGNRPLPLRQGGVDVLGQFLAAFGFDHFPSR